MAEQQEKAPKVSSAKKDAGTWVVVDDNGQVLAIERSEVRAWRIAGPLKALAVWWPFGKTRDEVLVIPPVSTGQVAGR